MELSLDRRVRLLPTRQTPGPLNMAFDAVAAGTVTAGGPASVRVYGWEPSALSLGYAQDPDTIDWGYCDRHGIDVTRRPTGGGAIYHDRLGDVSYSIVLPGSAVESDLITSYRSLCTPVIDALGHLGIDVAFSKRATGPVHPPACYLRGLEPAHDLVARTNRGVRKISGNAQHRQRDAVVQHGSITVHREVDRHLGCFVADVDPDTFCDRVTSVRELVDADRAAVIDALESAFRTAMDADPASWTDDERRRARNLVERKFGDDAWVRERRDPVGQ